MPNQEQNTSECEFYNDNGVLYMVDKNGDVFELDFDEQPKNAQHDSESIKNNIEVETDMEKITEKPEQVIEKPEATEDVKEEITEDKKEETVEVCKKEYDFLKTQAEKLKKIESEKTSIEKELETFKNDFKELKDSIEAERKAKIEDERVKKIDQIANDFDIPKEKLENKTLDMLIEYEEMLDLAIKRNKGSEEQEEDFKPSEPSETVEERLNTMKKRYKLEL